MTDEAGRESTEHAWKPADAGWFVANLDEARWQRSDRFGDWCAFEGDDRWKQLGLNVHVLQPGQPACLYHRENQQEAFLVLSGECLLVVEGQERRLRQWDFFHAPPGTEHVFVGAGDGPCAVLMTGARIPDRALHYPVDETAAKHGASVENATDSPPEAYAGTPKPFEIPSPWPLPERPGGDGSR